MIEIRIHGRGGQGSVTAAELLAVAAFDDGREAQAFPAFGVERRGAPVQAFCRIADEPIRRRSQIYNPDYVIVQDPTLLDTVDVLGGLDEGGTVLINTERSASELDLDTKARVVTFPATQIAMEELGRPIMNTAIMGAFAGVSGAISFDAIERSIRHRFGEELGEKNVRAAKRAYDSMKEQSE
ncbi:MAG: pyruvate ferredoxin oxidoreductase subunit gamma [Armatimonadetes bacterium]|nr:pyruvate ferredoxin oxidoreductase subunit gamma [Armatimonadota bacterium]